MGPGVRTCSSSCLGEEAGYAQGARAETAEKHRAGTENNFGSPGLVSQVLREASQMGTGNMPVSVETCVTHDLLNCLGGVLQVQSRLAWSEVRVGGEETKKGCRLCLGCCQEEGVWPVEGFSFLWF